MNKMKLEINNINPEAASGFDMSTEPRVFNQWRARAREVSMSRTGSFAVVGLAALVLGVLTAYAAVSGGFHGSAGQMDEVVVTAHAPAMMLDEVVVRPWGVADGLMPEVVVTAAGPRMVVAAPSVVPVELN
jgi:hypothetical protein